MSGAMGGSDISCYQSVDGHDYDPKHECCKWAIYSVTYFLSIECNHSIGMDSSNKGPAMQMVLEEFLNPGNSFLYDFSVPNQAGTFWYHAHLCRLYFILSLAETQN
jgi:hypothetical protein